MAPLHCFSFSNTNATRQAKTAAVTTPAMDVALDMVHVYIYISVLMSTRLFRVKGSRRFPRGGASAVSSKAFFFSLALNASGRFFACVGLDQPLRDQERSAAPSSRWRGTVRMLEVASRVRDARVAVSPETGWEAAQRRHCLPPSQGERPGWLEARTWLSGSCTGGGKRAGKETPCPHHPREFHARVEKSLFRAVADSKQPKINSFWGGSHTFPRGFANISMGISPTPAWNGEY